MRRDQKLAIILEGQQNGVSETCKNHKISRTIYYRWIKRYKTQGIAGLDPSVKNFIPTNKTDSAIDDLLFLLIKKHTAYGPRALKYLLEDLGYSISESAIYNIMKRNHLNTRQQRVKFSQKKVISYAKEIPSLDHLTSGEGWFFWITHLGSFKNIGDLYAYTFFDYKSKITCSRLYQSISINYFEDLLAAAAIPVAQTMQFETKYLYLFKEDGLCNKNLGSLLNDIERIALEHGFDISVHCLESGREYDESQSLKKEYNAICVSELIPWIQQGLSLERLKNKFQHFVRDYNMYHESLYEDQRYTPIEYHTKSKNTGMILPLWAYMDRDY